MRAARGQPSEAAESAREAHDRVEEELLGGGPGLFARCKSCSGLFGLLLGNSLRRHLVPESQGN